MKAYMCVCSYYRFKIHFALISAKSNYRIKIIYDQRGTYFYKFPLSSFAMARVKYKDSLYFTLVIATLNKIGVLIRTAGLISPFF